MLAFLLLSCMIWNSASAQEPLYCDKSCVADTRSILKDAPFSNGYPNSWIEKANLRLGDKIAIALRSIYRGRALYHARNVRLYLPVIRTSFLTPKMITEAQARQPRRVLALLVEIRSQIADVALLREIDRAREFLQGQVDRDAKMGTAK